MTERNAEYADARVKVDIVVRAREDMIGSLVDSYHAYEDLVSKTTKGLEFYDKLEVNVRKLLTRVGGAVKEAEQTAQLNSSAMKAADAHALLLNGIDDKERAEEEEEVNVEEEEVNVDEEEVNVEEDSEEEEFVVAGEGRVQVVIFVLRYIKILIVECQSFM